MTLQKLHRYANKIVTARSAYIANSQANKVIIFSNASSALINARATNRFTDREETKNWTNQCKEIRFNSIKFVLIDLKQIELDKIIDRNRDIWVNCKKNRHYTAHFNFITAFVSMQKLNGNQLNKLVRSLCMQAAGLSGDRCPLLRGNRLTAYQPLAGRPAPLIAIHFPANGQ